VLNPAGFGIQGASIETPESRILNPEERFRRSREGVRTWLDQLFWVPDFPGVTIFQSAFNRRYIP
jgi:hypothetical protein